MGRNVALTLGLAGIALIAATVLVYSLHCDVTRFFPLLVAGYVVGVILVAVALIGGMRTGMGIGIIVAMAIAIVAVAIAYIAFLFAFARCFEF
ncbi:hypothetical protein ACIBHX_18295 [Nonomuraea sp. NPDC050536]|uniref:hypothetical protein n=1 Tax=Nonomuraea sp. NPDC050536 TaxID=3364366 RepID=UPI0037C73A47